MFEVQVSKTMKLVVTQYWNVVQARGNLEVARTSLDATEAPTSMTSVHWNWARYRRWISISLNRK
jgi:hypothetical protein